MKINNLRYCLAVVLFACTAPATSQSLPDIKDVFQNELACAVVEPLLAVMPVQTLYLQQGGDCVAVTPDDQQGMAYFADAQCRLPIDFAPTPLREHCSVLLDSNVLGEGEGANGTDWTLSPGSRMDLGAKSLDGLHQPYLQRSIYRSIDTAGGRCKLEMRVYTGQPGLSEQRSLLALHGGSWSARGFGFFGLEFTIPHFVEQGFVVYAPFYRLLGDSDGSPACNNATIGEIVEDAEAALLWVQGNAHSYGSDSQPVVFGQSAGAHLATSLAVNQSQAVAAAVLYYPPTDFADFALRVQGGYYANEQGLGILERVIGSTAVEADLNAPPIAENSFPTRIIEQDLDAPPVFMVHGMADDLVEPRQAVRLCEAIDRSALTSVDQEIIRPSLLREIRQCGVDSSLHLISEGQHALDVCIADTFIATDLCPSGSEASRAEVASAITASAVFAREQADSLDSTQTMDGEETDGEETSNETGTDAGSGGGLALWLCVLLAIALFRSDERAIRSMKSRPGR